MKMQNGTEKQIKFAESIVSKWVAVLTYDEDNDFFEKGPCADNERAIEKLLSLNDAIVVIEQLGDAMPHNALDKIKAL